MGLIFKYTDEEALADGVLVEVDGRHRMTSAMFAWLSEEVNMGSAQPPDGWPVAMMEWFGASATAGSRALALAKGIVARDATEARRVHEKNIHGGIFEIELELETKRTAWLVPNELGGVTLMFSEGY